MLLPLLCGAQYGLSHAVVSSALLAALAWGHELGHGGVDAAMISSWSLGGLIAGAIAGQFRDAREDQKRRLSDQLTHLSERLERAERGERVLRLSHSRLSERLAATRWSLVGSLEQAQRRMQELSSRRELGEVVLELLASQAMVQSASLYWSGSGLLLPFAVASLGSSPNSSALHPLVLRAFKTRRLTAVADASAAAADGGDDGTVLAAVPVVTSSGHIVGVVAIHQIPFMALQTDQLRQLLVIMGQLGDMMHDRLRELAAHSIVGQRSAVAQVVPAPPPPIGKAAAAVHHAAAEPAAAARNALAARVFNSPN